MVRHFIKPGITGWAQINGFRGETTKLEEMEGRIKKDIWYIENWSIWLDVKIVFKTVFVMLIGDKKAY
jgi:putative colanic acid biosynthesis UDP-glucose lipid carrier transferase